MRLVAVSSSRNRRILGDGGMYRAGSYYGSGCTGTCLLLFLGGRKKDARLSEGCCCNRRRQRNLLLKPRAGAVIGVQWLALAFCSLVLSLPMLVRSVVFMDTRSSTLHQTFLSRRHALY